MAGNCLEKIVRSRSCGNQTDREKVVRSRSCGKQTDREKVFKELVNFPTAPFC